MGAGIIDFAQTYGERGCDMMQWFYMKNGNKVGPISTAELKRLAASGELQLNDRIWREGLKNWIPAANAKGLFNSKTTSAAPDEYELASPATSTDINTASDQITDEYELAPQMNTTSPRKHENIPVQLPRHAAPPVAPAIKASTHEESIIHAATIKYSCIHCDSVLESEGRLAGQRDTCPNCKKVVPVPVQSTVGLEAVLGKIPKKVYLAGIAGMVVLLVVLTAWLMLRDTWEKDHRTEVLRLSEDSISLIQAKRIADGVVKYDKLVQLVGKRKLSDSELIKAMADARDVADPFWQKQQEAEAITNLLGIESQAKAFVGAADFERGIEKYQQALDLIKNTKSDNPEYAAAVGRISQAKTFVSARLDQKRRDDEAERKRIEEEKKMASIKAHIKGGAWLTKEAGSSDTLRGLKIYFLRSPGTNLQLLAMLQAVIDDNSLRLTEANKKLVDDEKEARSSPNYEYYQDKARSSKDRVNTLQKTLASLQDQLATAAKVGGNVPVDLATIYALHPDLPTAQEIQVWAAICNQQIAGRVHTDVDGKYNIEVTGGYYFLYAEFKASRSLIKWFVPVKVSDAKDVVVDLHNENAHIIY